MADLWIGRLIDHLHPRAGDLEARACHPGDCAAFLLDPDGNNVEAVFHGPARRNAPWIGVTPDPAA
jgi:hypothetical protein